MATVNLGAIRYNWKGAYSGSTAYVVNDVVSANGNSYICIQAGTGQAVGNATAYWNIMSSAGTNGTNGTDLTSTLTTQGDILYRDGSGLQRLGYGTSGKVLTTKGSGQNPAWETASGGKVLQYVSTNDNTQYGVNTGTTPNAVQGTAADLTITPSSTSSRILVTYHWGAIHSHESSSLGYGVIRYNVGGGGFGDVTPLGVTNVAGSSKHHFKITLEASSYMARPITYGFIHHPNTTSAVIYRPYFWTESSGGYTYINRSARDGGNDAHAVMMSYAMELEG